MRRAMADDDNGGISKSAFTWKMVAPDTPIISVAPNMMRTVAISQILAAQCDLQDERVAHFRKERLEGKLLVPDAIKQWIEQMQDQDGTPSLFIQGLPWEALEQQKDGSYVLQQPWVAELMKEVLSIPVSPGIGVNDAWSDPEERPHLQLKFLWYTEPDIGEDKVPAKAVRAGGILDGLRQLSVSLLRNYPMWGSDAQEEPATRRARGLARAATYVLTGYAPLIDESSFPLRSGKGVHPQSAKHLQLAVFTVHHTGEKLADRMAEWNRQFPDWAYTRTTNFGWDSRQALRRLMQERDDRVEGFDLNTYTWYVPLATETLQLRAMQPSAYTASPFTPPPSTVTPEELDKFMDKFIEQDLPQLEQNLAEELRRQNPRTRRTSNGFDQGA